MIRFNRTVLALVIAGSVPFAHADPDAALGDRTRQWLEHQSGGTVASPNRQTLSGPVAEAIHQRYLDSFKHTVPVFYKYDKINR